MTMWWEQANGAVGEIDSHCPVWSTWMFWLDDTTTFAEVDELLAELVSTGPYRHLRRIYLYGLSTVRSELADAEGKVQWLDERYGVQLELFENEMFAADAIYDTGIGECEQ